LKAARNLENAMGLRGRGLPATGQTKSNSLEVGRTNTSDIFELRSFNPPKSVRCNAKLALEFRPCASALRPHSRTKVLRGTGKGVEERIDRVSKLTLWLAFSSFPSRESVRINSNLAVRVNAVT
jgi:hypothetical protein